MKTRKILIGIGVALVVLALAAGAWLLGSQLWGQGCWGYSSGLGIEDYGSGMMGSYGSPWGMPRFGGGIFMFLFWGVIVGGIVLLVVGLARQGTQATGQGGSLRSESPLEILKRRYASGEIDRDEYKRMEELLSS